MSSLVHKVFRLYLPFFHEVIILEVIFNEFNFYLRTLFRIIGVPSIGAGGGPAPPPPQFLKNLQAGPLSFLKICRRPPPPVFKKIYFHRTLMFRIERCSQSKRALLWNFHNVALRSITHFCRCKYAFIVWRCSLKRIGFYFMYKLRYKPTILHSFARYLPSFSNWVFLISIYIFCKL